jgi:hypothetical protein
MTSDLDKPILPDIYFHENYFLSNWSFLRGKKLQDAKKSGGPRPNARAHPSGDDERP